MKKIIIGSFVLLAAAGITFGQAAGVPKPQSDPQTDQRKRDSRAHQAEKSTASGSLALVKGRIAVQSDNVTCYLTGINRLIGFVDGLKEGAKVTLEGYAITIPKSNPAAAEEKIFRITKLSFNGKEYELNADSAPHFSQGSPYFSHPSKRAGTMKGHHGDFQRFRRRQEFRKFHNGKQGGKR
ncbi:MAG: hypothetical protein LBB61_01080 [Treponema sp.]|jgi:hypothetical protein|nr:hypothetical protein [Treponema sp.]